MESENDLLKEEDEFQFETDHLALRGNKDYSSLLRYIVMLEVQKIKAIKDVDEIAETQRKALQEPLQFVQNLKSGNLNLPARQIIKDIPEIDWKKYGLEDVKFAKDSDKKNLCDEDESTNVVRGRLFNQDKPESFNQLWSCEEQQRLEELLEIYPEEEVEARRYKKIAKALGTRTHTQVNSRIQKYFSKLAKAGLPIPGRIPKGSMNIKSATNTKYRSNKFLYKKSTFFPQLNVPVHMEDQNEIAETMSYGNSNESSEELPSSSTTASHKLFLLKAAREQRILDETYPIYHKDTMCVGCGKDGFAGACWTDNAGTDYCTDCIVNLLPVGKFTPVRRTH